MFNELIVQSWMISLCYSSIFFVKRMEHTSAPPSSTISFVTGSLCTAAVSPTPLLPLPVVYTPLGATLTMCFSSWLLATPGSPIKQTWTSPLIYTLNLCRSHGQSKGELLHTTFLGGLILQNLEKGHCQKGGTRVQTFMPSESCREGAPTNSNNRAFLTSSCPKISGAIEEASLE